MAAGAVTTKKTTRGGKRLDRRWGGGSMRDDARWAVVVYHIPVEPSRLRAEIWRRLQGLGAVYLQKGVAAVPAESPIVDSLQEVHRMITDVGGVCYLLRAECLAGQTELTATYNRARNEEYAELIELCAVLIAQANGPEVGVARRREARALKQNLVQARGAFQQIRGLDVFGAELAEEAMKEVRCLERAVLAATES